MNWTLAESAVGLVPFLSWTTFHAPATAMRSNPVAKIKKGQLPRTEKGRNDERQLRRRQPPWLDKRRQPTPKYGGRNNTIVFLVANFSFSSFYMYTVALRDYIVSALYVLRWDVFSRWTLRSCRHGIPWHDSSYIPSNAKAQIRFVTREASQQQERQRSWLRVERCVNFNQLQFLSTIETKRV